MLRQAATTILVFGVLCTLCTGQKYGYYDSRFPYIRDKPYPFITPNPMALETKTAKPIDVEPMEIDIPEDAVILLNNFGAKVGGFQIKGEQITLTKGVVFRDKYVLYEVGHHSDGVPNGVVSSTQDGKGAPIEMAMYWYNSKYKSPEGSGNYTDGLLVIVTPCPVQGNKDNPYLQPYVWALTKLVERNSSTQIPAKDALAWFIGVIRSCPYYYAYPGTFGANNGVKLYPTANAITIQIPLTPTTFASYRQFNAFTSLKNEFNGPMANPLPRFPQHSRPVVEVCACTRIYYSH